VTELIDGHQLIKVTDPTNTWLRVYKGFDQCMSGQGASDARTVCIAPAVERQLDDWVPYVPAGIVLGAFALFVIHFLRPAGPIRRRRHYRRTSRELMLTVPGDAPMQLRSLDIKQLQKRLRRLEQSIAPVLTESQHHWCQGLLGAGRHGMALESLTRWFAESHLPVPDHIRDEILWIASSLQIERMVRPVLDAQVQAHTEDLHIEYRASQGFDIPLAEFKVLVAEAVDSLPAPFGRAMTNVAILIEEEHPNHDRLGQYEGLPLSRRIVHTWSVHPDKITIYRRTICDHCRSRTEVRAMVDRVVIHEIAHHFGIDDPRLRELGW
jgi:predicted Zn-dependent protease with MMP-like domain